MKRLFGITGIVIVFLLLAACGQAQPPAQEPQAENGVLDLTNWDLAQDGPVNLSGEWEFYWGQLLQPDDFAGSSLPPRTGLIELPVPWNGYVVDGVRLLGDGYATYRLQILLNSPDLFPLALKVPEFETAFVLYVDGREIGSNGVVGKTPEMMRPQWLPQVADFPAQDQLEVVLQISNFHHRKGGAGQVIQLGTEDQIRKIREANLNYELFLFGSLFIMGLYHVVLFVLRRRDRSSLYFGLCCFLMSLRVLVTGEYFLSSYFPDLEWEFVVKLNYLSFGLTPPLFIMFARILFPKEISNWSLRILQFFGGIFAAIILFAPARIFTHTLLSYQVVILIGAVYFLSTVVLAVVRKREGAVIFLSCFFVLLLAMINDILHNNQIIQTGYFGPLGIFIFILAQATLLARRFSKALVEVETLSEELEQRVVARTEELSISNEQLTQVNLDLQQEITKHQLAQETLHSYANRLRTMHEIDQSILTARSAETIAVAATSRIRHLVLCQRVIVIEVMETGQIKKLAAESSGEIALRPDVDIYYEMFETQSPRYGLVHGIEDLGVHPERSPMQQVLYSEGVRSYVVVPLRVQDELIGTLHLEANHPRTFTSDHINSAIEIAILLAVGIRQARLYEQAQREIVERKQAEMALRQRTIELEERNAELDAFAHTVAHDLKNPLTSLIGFGDLLEGRLNQMSEEAVYYNLQFIGLSARKMDSIINELLLLSSVRAMEEIQTEPLHMGYLVTEAQERLAHMIDEHQPEIILPDRWLVARGYAAWIEEVWANYLSNAIKYGGRPPRIELGATPQPNGFVRFWVRDNGSGLSPEQQERLFSPFERLGQVRTKGHGLGLSIVLRIVEKLGGQVGVESEVDQGSEFFFTLPT
ncbi:MAG: GAF domain-containing protein [Chloroflexi bacterium]|nr:GAF domain-containing protein [Chloroflexota bacterium]